ncbi:MAG: hypothetical protein K2K05_00710 [Muribaculaceae bacterium]|nr:hypothetical protein [Muribaculaceae bacterium]
MKKIYSLMIVAILAMVGSIASMAADVTFTLNIDNPEAVIAETSSEQLSLVAGDNEFTFPEWTGITVRAIPPYAFESVTNEAGDQMSIYDNTWYFYPSEYNKGVFTIKTVNLDEKRTASCTVNVDCAEMVRVIRTGTYTNVDLTDGENIVKFDPEIESTLMVSAVDYMIPLYEVTVDGVNVAMVNREFSVPLSDGCIVDITAKIPEKEVTVTFDYSANEEGVGAIESVSVNDEPVENFDGLTLVTMAGSKVTIAANKDYKLNNMSIDGVPTNWTGGYPYTIVVVNDTKIDIDAAPLGTLTTTVLVDDPTNIIFYRGYAYNNDVVALEAGENILEFTEGNSVVAWKAADGCLINAVMLNNEILSEYTSYVSLAEGDVLEFITDKIVMDKEFVFWIDDRAAADMYFSLMGSDRSTINVESGYNLVEYYEKMVPFALSWYSENTPVSKVYIDGEEVEPLYEGSNSYELNVADKSVVKVFLTTEPEECNVKVNLNDNPDVTVAYDILAEVTEFPAEIKVFKGTLFTITPAADENITVIAGETEIACNEDGIYEIEIADADTEITVAKTTGIASVTNTAINGDIYNVLGVKVGVAADFNRLPAGIYILNGKKGIKK